MVRVRTENIKKDLKRNYKHKKTITIFVKEMDKKLKMSAWKHVLKHSGKDIIRQDRTIPCHHRYSEVTGMF